MNHWKIGLQPWHVIAVALAFVLAPSAQGQGTGPIKQASARAEFSPLDQPLAWMEEAKRNFTAVKDYTCTLVSRERVRGELLEENIMQMKVKSQPSSIYMRWLAPKKYQGQEVAFVLGKNNNKMRVKSNMIGKNLIGFLSIDPHDPRALEHSRHTILEAGIGNMIDQTIKCWITERPFDKIDVKTSESVYNERKCIRVEVIRTERNASFQNFRTVMYLERESKLPIRLENYDWPRQGGPAEGDLLEVFSYVNLQFNTGLRDEEFNK